MAEKKSLKDYKAEAAARNARLESEADKKKQRYKEGQQRRQEEGEEGLRPTSFTEIPGAAEGKASLRSGLEKLNMPGAKVLSKAADVILPENLTEVSGPILRGAKALSMMGKAPPPKYVKTGKVFEKSEEAGTLKKASEDIKKAEAANPRTYSKTEAADPKNTPERVGPQRTGERKLLSDEEVEKRKAAAKARNEAKKVRPSWLVD